jgi:DHA1 family inner membrane transport protein
MNMHVPEPAAAARPGDADLTRIRIASWALMLGNFITGLAVLAPAGMLNELSAELNVSIQQAGWLVTFGAIVLCFGSPLVAWATSTLDRRLLLTVTLAVMAIGHAASAFAPNYAVLLTLRLAMLAVAAVFTPQAAGTITLMVTEKERASAISFVFLGWSLALAIGLPIVQTIADHLGWRATYGALATVGAVVFVLALIGIPAGLRGAPLSLKSWGAIAQNRLIVILLAITALWVSGTFEIFPYVAPLLAKLSNAPPAVIAGCFALMGGAGFIGNVIATRAVRRLGEFKTGLIFLLLLLVGGVIWIFGVGSLAAMATGAAFLGLGTLALNSMQQARLVAAAPALAGGTVALNTSALYVGQAVGSGVGGALFEHGLASYMGYVTVAFLLAALALMLVTRPSAKV